MRQRLESLLFGVAKRARQPLPIFAALRRVRQKGYDLATLRADVFAGLVVGAVALPLSMALGIAVGVAPQNGLYTAIVAGAVVAITGGSKFQVTGPTAAFVVILAPIVTKFGLSGLLTAGIMAGLMLIAMGLSRMGRLIQYIPHPVTSGFTAGIGVVIATLQVKDFFGLQIEKMPDGYGEKVAAFWGARDTASLWELVVGAVTLALLVYVPRLTKRVPAPLVALGFAAVATALLHRLVPSFDVATINSRFHYSIDGVVHPGIPPLPPHPIVPWGGGHMSLALLRELAPAAFAIAMLGAIESLLSAVIADGMTGTRHDPNAELVGLGIGNVIAPFFGGIAATGALARTATNVRAGARTPVSAIVHSITLLACMVFLARFVSYVPMASLAALLLLVAWNMSEVRHALHIVRIAPKSDAAVLLTCFFLTVWFDMVVAVSVGILLAALLFMRRMGELVSTRVVLDSSAELEMGSLPKGVVLYEIAGPLFFGAAQNAMNALSNITSDVRVLVLDLGRVPTIDATGLVALESAIEHLFRENKRVIIAGPLPAPSHVFKLASFAKTAYMLDTRAAALELAASLAVLPGEGPPSRSQLIGHLPTPLPTQLK